MFQRRHALRTSLLSLVSVAAIATPLATGAAAAPPHPETGATPPHSSSPDTSPQTPSEVSTTHVSMPRAGVLETGARAVGSALGVAASADEKPATSAPVAVDSDVTVLGATWEAGTGENASLQYRVRTGDTWGEWQHAGGCDCPSCVEVREASAAATGRDGTDAIVITGADAVQARLVNDTGDAARSPQLAVIDPGNTEVVHQAAPVSAVRGTTDTAGGVLHETLTETTAGRVGAAPIASGTVGAQAVTMNAASSGTGTADSSPNVAATTSGMAAAPGTTSGTPGSTATTFSLASLKTGADSQYVRSRASWGADEASVRGTSRFTPVGVAIHHTAGSNTYTPEQVPAILRGIQRFHVQDRKWADIGYNALVDKWGRVWEGRRGGLDAPVVGAHAAPFNSTLAGLSVLGDYNKAVPTQETVDALTWAVRRVGERHGFNPNSSATIKGQWRPRVVGHGDVNSTSCPGTNLRAQLPTIRSRADLAGSVTSPSPAPTPATTESPSPVTAPSGTVSPVPAVSAAPTPDTAPADPLPTPTASATSTPTPSTTPTPTPSPAPMGNPAAQQLRPGATTRTGGANRFLTSVEVSRASYAPGVDSVFLANGESFPDALAGGPLAAKLGGPILLTQKDRTPTAVREEIERLKPRRVWVLGGPASVSDAQVRYFRQKSPRGAGRLAGDSRYATAADTALRFGTAETVYVASGLSYPDALSAGDAGAATASPVLLSARTWLPRETADALATLRPRRVVLVGGPAVLSSGLENQIREAAGTAQVSRLAGPNRYATSAAVTASVGARDGVVYVSGEAFPDALTAVPATHAAGAGLALTTPSCLPPAVASSTRQSAEGGRWVIGGPAAVGRGAIDRVCR